MSLTTTTKAEKGWRASTSPLLNKNKSLKFDTHQVDIEDARGHEHGYTLDKNGFEFFNVPTTFTDFDNEDAIKTHYLIALAPPHEDLQPYITRFPTGTVNEGASLRFREGQRFVWWSGMQVGEVVVIKLFDSKLDGRASCAPHSAFVGDGDYGVRRSVETRVLVFWEGEGVEWVA
ncbi:hypothetical protein B0A48_11572 [Cryoendolithus antarcticus]|uniref:Uncharacterized protein n=1 Tax=Cryoendolithus antarcticus TaxID=1507870 RepID=A0A1V8SVY9_9PEZI|nr:hypothetical protein B0A48_11572 [Cryoendolithus antarcticus]